MEHKNTYKIAYIGLIAAFGIVCSYIEILIPFNFGIPGIKLGLANIAAIIALYLISFRSALLIQIIRIIIVGLLFGNLYSIMYSIAGGLFSIVLMFFIKKLDKFSVVGVSICGGVSHNIAQLFVAMIVVNQVKLAFYGPILFISGIITGIVIGVISIPILKVLKHMFDSGKIIL